MSVDLIASLPLGGINIGLAGSLTAIVPLLAQFDLMLTGSFGLGALQADLALQFNAAISLQANLSLQISNPFASLMAQLQAILQIQAGIKLTISLGLPAVSVTLSASLSASASISAALALRLGGIGLLIKLALSVKIPVVSLMAQFTAALQAGPVVLLSTGFRGSPVALAQVGSDFQALASAGVGGLNPTDQVYGVFLLTASPSASASMSAILLTS